MDFMKLLCGDTEIIRHIDSPDDVVFVSDDLNSEGFTLQPEGVRFCHIFKDGKKGSKLWATSPSDGEYYVALQILDTFGPYDEEFIPAENESCAPFGERLTELSINEKKTGRFRFGGDDRKYYFFVTEESIALKKGDKISYEILSGEGAIFTAIVLMKNKTEEKLNSIMNLTTDNGEIRFWTKVACRTKIIFGDKVLCENMYLNNHRFTVPKEWWGIRFVIETLDEAGNILRGRGTCKAKEAEKINESDVYVPLKYSERTKEIRPVMSVLPLKKGMLSSADNITIYDEDENPYPVQKKVTSRWQDNTLRTVALCANLPADGRKFYIKNSAVSDFQDENFRVYRKEASVVVVCGKNTYEFSDESKYILPDRKMKAVLYDTENNRYTACGGKYEIEESGINHIAVKRINHFMSDEKQHMKCLTHIHFYRGFNAYRMEFGFENDLMENEFCKINGMYLEEECNAEEITDVVQLDEKTVCDKGVKTEMKHSGEFFSGEKSVVIEDFWQNYPKSVQSSQSKLKIGICPLITEPGMYTDEDITLESRLFFYLKTGVYEFHCGLRKYHSIAFGTDAKKICNILFMPPMGSTVEESGAFGNIKCDCPDFPGYDSYMENSLDLYMNHREKYREYGMLNYGDSFGEREIHWTNMEYDFPYGMLIHFLRTGDYRFYKMAKSAAAHYAEIDNSHRNIHFEEDGYFFIHTVGHANNYYEFKKLPQSFEKIKTHIGHLFSQGVAEYYKVTGIERYKDTIIRCADSIARYNTVKYDFLTEREPGWGMLTLICAYEMTLDEFYLNACRIMAERVMEKQDSKSGCIRMFMYMTPKEGMGRGEVCYGGKPFMHGILGTALKYLYNLTGDERMKESAIAIGRWLAEEMFDEETNQFWYTDAFKRINQRVNQPETSVEILDAVLFASLESGKNYLETARKAFENMLNSPYRRECDISKVYSMRLRFAPEIMYYYSKAKEKYKKI